MSLLAEIAKEPAKVRAYMARLETLEAAIIATERIPLTRADTYTDTASGTYTQAEVQALMDQTAALSTTCRALVDIVKVSLSELREK